MNFEIKQEARDSSLCTKRNLILICSIISLVAVALLISLIVVLNQQNESKEVCWTPGCIHTASLVIKNMNESIDPCDDFYDFACGKFLEDNIIPEDKSSISTFSVLGDKVRDQLKLLLDQPLSPRTPRPYHMVKKLYNICMNTTAIEEDGVHTVKALLKDVGGWPLLEGSGWNENSFEWKKAMYKLRKHSLSAGHFLGLYVCADERNSTRRVICTDEMYLSLSREFIIKGWDEKLVKAFYDYIVDIAEYFGANRAAALKELKEVVDLQIKFAEIKIPKEDRRNSSSTYNPMTIEELQRTYPNIPWLEYITNVLDIPDIEITDDDIVIVSVPSFIPKLDALLRKTPKRVQANYVMTNVALGTIHFLTEKFRNRQQEFRKVLVGASERQARWKECVWMAHGSLSLAFGSVYVRKFFNETSKIHAEEMVKDIQAEFLNRLKVVDWMDDETRASAISKAEKIVNYIGYPDELMDDKKIDKFYSSLDIPTENFLKASITISAFYTDYYNKKLREPVNKTEWLSHAYPTVINAFYDASENSIEFPAGILQGVFFGNDRPRYMNYGAIGFVIGHEITHGFDDEGRQYDEHGNLNEWWDEDTKEAFVKKAQCIIDQYGNYTVPEIDMNLNGISTQGENIADNGGIKEAYLAYLRWVERNGPEPRLPGVKYTPEQMFWISAANTWCSKERKEILKLQVASGYHSPSKFRINGSFKNSKQFAKAFSCPVGSNMNPKEKCVVW